MSTNTRMVAFLRAVNVGGRTAKSPQLIQSFHSLGFENVTTFLASGNVLFSGISKAVPKLRGRIEGQLLADLGFLTEVILRSMEQVAAIADLNPFQLTDVEKESYTVNVALFLEQPTSAMQKEVLKLKGDYDDFVFDGNEMYWLCRGAKISASPLFSNNRLAKAASEINTIRNIRTMQRLVAIENKSKR